MLVMRRGKTRQDKGHGHSVCSVNQPIESRILPGANGSGRLSVLFAASHAQALLCAYMGAQPEGSLSPEQLTRLAHAVRLAHITPYFLVEVAPSVGWLCAEGQAAMRSLVLARMGGPARQTPPAAWLPSAPARAGKVDPASRLVEWELPLAQLQPLVDKVAAGSSGEYLTSPNATAAFGLGWGLKLVVAPLDARSATRPRAVNLGLFLEPHFTHVPAPQDTATFR
jgi:hypothetical protein